MIHWVHHVSVWREWGKWKKSSGGLCAIGKFSARWTSITSSPAHSHTTKKGLYLYHNKNVKRELHHHRHQIVLMKLMMIIIIKSRSHEGNFYVILCEFWFSLGIISEVHDSIKSPREHCYWGWMAIHVFIIIKLNWSFCFVVHYYMTLWSGIRIVACIITGYFFTIFWFSSYQITFTFMPY